MSVWMVYAELGPCSQYPSGAFVEYYARAADIRAAIDLAIDALQSDGFEAVHLSKCIEFDEDEWDDENDPHEEVRSLVRQVELTGDVLAGPFRCWGDSEEE